MHRRKIWKYFALIFLIFIAIIFFTQLISILTAQKYGDIQATADIILKNDILDKKIVLCSDTVCSHSIKKLNFGPIPLGGKTISTWLINEGKLVIKNISVIITKFSSPKGAGLNNSPEDLLFLDITSQLLQPVIRPDEKIRVDWTVVRKNGAIQGDYLWRIIIEIY